MLNRKLERLASLLVADPTRLLRQSDPGVDGPARDHIMSMAFRAWVRKLRGGGPAEYTAEIDADNDRVTLSIAGAPWLFPQPVVTGHEWDSSGRLVDFAIDGAPVSSRLFTLLDDTHQLAALGSWNGPHCIVIAPLVAPTGSMRRNVKAEIDNRHIDARLVAESPATWALETSSVLDPVPGGLTGVLTWTYGEYRLHDTEASISEVVIRFEHPHSGTWRFTPQPIDDIADLLARWCL